jgi:hypothetical protein
VADSYIKDPAARLDYTWGWSDWLAEITDTISSATVTVPDGLTAVGVPVVTDTDVTQRIEGGTLDEAYRMVCQITTVGGLIDERSIYLTISNR